MARTVEADVCIVGAGITAAMVAAKLADATDAEIVVVEAGGWPASPEERASTRRRYLRYGENPWPEDHLRGQTVLGRAHGFSPSMQVGGLAMHWGGVTPRFTPEDLRVASTYGVGTDWPLSYDELAPFYLEAEERLGVAGEPGPASLDPRRAPFPMDPLPLTWNLERLRDRAAGSGVPFWPMAQAKNSRPYAGRPTCCRNDTCYPICPIGAKYSPDFTFRELEADGRVRVVPRTLIRRLEVEEGSERVAAAVATTTGAGASTPGAEVAARPPARGRGSPPPARGTPAPPAAAGEEVRFNARLFVLAGGFVWTPHLLLLSRSSRHPEGLANRSGLVGRYLAGHRGVNAFVEVPEQLYPGINDSHSLLSTHFMREEGGALGGRRGDRYLRTDFRVWESAFGREARLADDDGRLLLGNDLLADWRERTEGKGTARLRCYYDVLPDRESALTLDPEATNRLGDPLPRVSFRDAPVSREHRGWCEATIRTRLEEMAAAMGGGLLGVYPSDAQEHPAGGCRMGENPDTSVVDPHGRAHDHENLFVVGAPVMPTAGCTNGTLTFCALGLRSAAAMARELGGAGARGAQASDGRVGTHPRPGAGEPEAR